MQNEFIFNLIAKKFTKEISEEEKVELEQWCNENSQNKKLYEKLNSIWQKSKDTNIDFDPEIPKAIEIFKERVKIFGRQKQKKVIRLRVMQMAASVIILLGLTFYLTTQKQVFSTIEVVTDNMGSKQIILPDSSYIYLNKNTSVKYKKSFKNRIVELNGEAFFEVKKQNGKPFTVKSNNTYIKVLGTSFNIKSRKEMQGSVQIFVLTGKVEFSGENKEKAVLLSPNQHAVYKNEISEIEVSELVDQNLLAWKTGKLIFENNSLKEVLKNLQNVYDIEYNITSGKVLDLKVTCEFNNVGIENILDDLEIILPIKINFENNIVKIESLK
ncbi:MAG: FecR domain-containing protein [Bacteroidales bacterium]|nr:FecR domain-containing protein [Bacteroidales bacterium]